MLILESIKYQAILHKKLGRSFAPFVHYCNRFPKSEKTLYFNHEFLRDVTHPFYNCIYIFWKKKKPGIGRVRHVWFDLKRIWFHMYAFASGEGFQNCNIKFCERQNCFTSARIKFLEKRREV